LYAEQKGIEYRFGDEDKLLLTRLGVARKAMVCRERIGDP
jgi:hypothetical protein